MKQMIIGILTVVSFQMALAQIPGGPVKHELSCLLKPGTELPPPVVVNYSMNCYTAALSPKYNLKGCELLMTYVIPPNSGIPDLQPQTIPLAPIKQTATMALLENSSQNIKVKVNKKNLSARAQLENGAILNCTNKMTSGVGGMSGSN